MSTGLSDVTLRAVVWVRKMQTKVGHQSGRVGSSVNRGIELFQRVLIQSKPSARSFEDDSWKAVANRQQLFVEGRL
jgi:hypothetical protein